MDLVKPLIRKASNHFENANYNITDAIFAADNEERLRAIDSAIFDLNKTIENLDAARTELQK